MFWERVWLWKFQNEGRSVLPKSLLIVLNRVRQLIDQETQTYQEKSEDKNLAYSFIYTGISIHFIYTGNEMSTASYCDVILEAAKAQS